MDNSVKSSKGLSISNWFVLCIIVFLISIFIHECGHGLANSLNGVACSTGFNRVGDIYKYPRDADFRAEYSSAPDSVLDFGVPATLLLAIAGTIIFYKAKGEKSKILALAFAATNSMMRLIPCLFVVLVPLFTGRIHNEDEYGTGLVLMEITGGGSWLIYLPALFSILISAICFVFLYRKLRVEISNKRFFKYGFFTLFSFYATMVIANLLDNIFRINWVAFG